MSDESNIIRVSYSSLQLLPCPRAFNMYITRMVHEVIPDDSTLRGRMIHDALRHFLQTGDSEELEELLYNAKYVIKKLRELTEYATKFKTEEEFKYELAPDIVVHGRYDLLIEYPDRLILIDFKTSRSTRITYNMKLQMDLYVYHVLEKYNKTVETYIYFVTKDELKEVKTYEPHDIFELNDSREKMLKRIRAVMEKGMESNSGSQCQYCPFVLTCPRFRIPIEQIRKEGEDELTALAREYIQSKARADALKKLIDAALNTQRKRYVEIGDKCVGYPKYITSIVDREMFYNYLKKHKFDKSLFETIVSPNVRGLKKLAEEDDDIANIVFWEEVEGRFSIFKKQEHED